MLFNSVEEIIFHNLNSKKTKHLNPQSIIKQYPQAKIQDVYISCNNLVKQGKLMKIYEVRCKDCSNLIGIFEKYDEIPNVITCNACDEMLEVDEGCIKVVYKPIK